MRKQMMLFSLAAVGVMFLLSGWAWFQLPANAAVPVHWGFSGQADRYGSKAEGLLLTPFLTLGISVLFYFLPQLDPRGKNLLRSEQAYRAMWGMMLVFLLGLHTTTTLIALGFQINIEKVLMPSLGILFIVLGNFMGKIRQNYTMGIRTPWTLNSEEIWNKTHRFGGRVFVAAGALTLIASFLSRSLAIPVLILSLVGAGLAPVIYSYLLYRGEQTPKKHE